MIKQSAGTVRRRTAYSNRISSECGVIACTYTRAEKLWKWFFFFLEIPRLAHCRELRLSELRMFSLLHYCKHLTTNLKTCTFIRRLKSPIEAKTRPSPSGTTSRISTWRRDSHEDIDFLTEKDIPQKKHNFARKNTRKAPQSKAPKFDSK